MEYIIVDTNIIYGDFFLESNKWKTLLWINKSDYCHICIPEFVFEETIKKYADCITGSIKALKTAKADSSKYRLLDIDFGEI